MEKSLDLKMPGVMELGREELKEVDGGVVWWILGSILTGVAGALIDGQGKVGTRGITESQYADCYEGCTGVQYEGWEAGF